MCWTIVAPSRKKLAGSLSNSTPYQNRARTAETDGRVVLMHDMVAGAHEVMPGPRLSGSFLQLLTAPALISPFGPHFANNYLPRQICLAARQHVRILSKMESELTNAETGLELPLAEPHFDDEATVLSARRVVPLDEVPNLWLGKHIALHARLDVCFNHRWRDAAGSCCRWGLLLLCKS